MKHVIENLDKGTSFAEGVYISKNCTIIGNVTLGTDVSIWYGTVIRGDVAPISIGSRSNVQDNSILHVTQNKPLTIGNNVSIGHGVNLHGCTIGNNIIIGIGAIILDDAIIEDNCVVAAGTLIPPRKKIPSGSMVMGNPGKIVRTLTEEDFAWIKANSDHYVEYKKIYSERGL